MLDPSWTPKWHLGAPFSARKATFCYPAEQSGTSWSRPGRDLAPKTLQGRIFIDLRPFFDRFWTDCGSTLGRFWVDSGTILGILFLNFAVLKKLPVLFICENNLYSVYSPLEVRQPKGRSIHSVAKSIGAAVFHGDGNNV